LATQVINRKVRRIAFLGGAFDPPHPGHEMMAKRVLESNLTDLVLWVPSWAPPHKNSGNMTEFFHRLNMVKLLTEQIPGCAVSDIEARRQFDPSYSFKVMSALAEENPDAEIQLLIGQDSLETLHTWYCARELAEKFEILTLPRRGESGDGSEVKLSTDFWGEKLYKKLLSSLIEGEFVEISSTNLRKELAKKQDLHNIINAEVLKYIEEHGLYR
jgi:nicotinate-nucleotide adenylyltransferase